MSHRTRMFCAAVISALLVLPASAGAASVKRTAEDAGTRGVTRDTRTIAAAPAGREVAESEWLDEGESDVWEFVDPFAVGDSVYFEVNGDPGTDFDIYVYKKGEDDVRAVAEHYYYPDSTHLGVDTAGVYEFEVVANGGSGTYTLTHSFASRVRPPVARISGSDRYTVAAAAAKTAFPNWAGITDIVVACGEDRATADPLCAAGMAGAYDAPVLLVKSTLLNGKLPGATEAAIGAIRAANGGRTRIHVVGGGVSVPTAVYNRLSALKGSGGTIERLNAADRYSLSVAMAKRADAVIRAKGGSVPFVLIGAGDNTTAFYDILAASGASYGNVAPTMLVKRTALPSSVGSALRSTFASKVVYCINGDIFVNGQVEAAARSAERLVAFDSDRYDNAAQIAWFSQAMGWSDGTHATVTNKLPDALTSGVLMGRLGGSIYYTPVGALDEATAWNLYVEKANLDKVFVVGGTASVSNVAFSDVGIATRF